MNITDVDRIETEGIETATEAEVLLDDRTARVGDAVTSHVLLRNRELDPAARAGDAIELADGMTIKLDKRVARNARATIFRCTLIEEEPTDGKPTA